MAELQRQFVIVDPDGKLIFHGVADITDVRVNRDANTVVYTLTMTPEGGEQP